jgi:hypothetical protein
MKLTKILIAVLACTAFLFAQEAAAPAAKAEKPAKAAKAAKEMSISGTVVSVDAIANTIIVKSKKAEDTLSVEAGAKIMQGKKEIALGDLKADAKVTVSCKTVDGKKVATKIVEKAAAKAEKTTKKTTEASSTSTTTTTTTEPAAAPAAAPAAK